MCGACLRFGCCWRWRRGACLHCCCWLWHCWGALALRQGLRHRRSRRTPGTNRPGLRHRLLRNTRTGFRRQRQQSLRHRLLRNTRTGQRKHRLGLNKQLRNTTLPLQLRRLQNALGHQDRTKRPETFPANAFVALVQATRLEVSVHGIYQGHSLNEHDQDDGCCSRPVLANEAVDQNVAALAQYLIGPH